MSAEAVAALLQLTLTIIDVAQEIGTRKWAALLTDNAPVIKKAWKIIMDAYSIPVSICEWMRSACREPFDDNQSDLLRKCIKIVKFILIIMSAYIVNSKSVNVYLASKVV